MAEPSFYEQWQREKYGNAIPSVEDIQEQFEHISDELPMIPEILIETEYKTEND